MNSSKFYLLLGLLTLLALVGAKKSDEKNKPEWAKKHISDYSDADMERLLDQWEVSTGFAVLFKFWCVVIYQLSYECNFKSIWNKICY